MFNLKYFSHCIEKFFQLKIDEFKPPCPFRQHNIAFSIKICKSRSLVDYDAWNYSYPNQTADTAQCRLAGPQLSLTADQSSQRFTLQVVACMKTILVSFPVSMVLLWRRKQSGLALNLSASLWYYFALTFMQIIQPTTAKVNNSSQYCFGIYRQTDNVHLATTILNPSSLILVSNWQNS